MEDRLAPGSMLSLAGAVGGPWLEILAASRLANPLADFGSNTIPAVSSTAGSVFALTPDLSSVAVAPMPLASAPAGSSSTAANPDSTQTSDLGSLSGQDFAGFGSSGGSPVSGAFSFGTAGTFAGGIGPIATGYAPVSTHQVAASSTPPMPPTPAGSSGLSGSSNTPTPVTSDSTASAPAPSQPSAPPSGGGGTTGPSSGVPVGRLRTIVPPAPSPTLTHTGYIGSQALMNLLFSYKPDPSGGPATFTAAQQMEFVLKPAPFGMDSVLVNTRWMPGSDLNTVASTLQQQLAATVTTITPSQSLVTAWLPLRNLTRLPNTAGFASVVPVYNQINMSGSVESQGDQLIGASGFRSSVESSLLAESVGRTVNNQAEATGNGVTVGILSDSINQINSNVDPNNHDIGIKESQDTGDLPSTGVNVLADGTVNPTDEGRGMAEVIYDVAPGASLAFNTSQGGPQAMAQGITNLATNAGASVIVDDTQYPDEPFFNNGVIAQAVNTVAKQNNVVYVSAAGNEGTAGWQANWNPITQTLPGGGGGSGPTQVFAVVNGVPVTQQKFTLPIGQTLNLALQWDSPFLEGGTDQPAFQVHTQINATIINADTGNAITTFNDDTQNTDEAMQRVVFTNLSQYGTTHFAMMFWLAAGPAPTQMRWIRFDHNPAAAYQGASTIFGHAASAAALTVGAVPWSNPTAPEISSSQGPTTLLGGDQGVHLTTPVTDALKPDIYGPDKINTAHFPAVPIGKTLPAGSDPVFTGTSAAAAHVAGVAALLRSLDPAAAYSQIVNQMEQTAAPVGTKKAGLVQTDTSGLNLTASASTGPAQIGAAVGATHQLENVTGEAIAINPTNPSMMVIAANPVNDLESGIPGLVLSVSLNGGQTWNDRLIANGLDGLPRSGGEPTVAFDKFGNLFLGYLDFSGAQIDILYSTDGGTTFHATAGLAGDDQPTLATGAGTVWVSYNNGSLQAAGAPVTGLGKVGAFASETVPNATNGNFGGIAIGPTGQVMVAFQTDTSGAGPDSIMVSVDADGLGTAGFSAPTVATSTNVGAFDPIPATGNRTIDAGAGLAWDQNAAGSLHPGRVYLVYTDASTAGGAATTIYERYSDNGGKTWSARVKVNSDTSGRSHFWPQIAVDQTSGNVAVSWLDARNDTGKGAPVDRDGVVNTDVNEYAAVSLDGGKQFSANMQVSAGPSNAAGVGNNDGFDFGDRTGLAFDHGKLAPAWPDNSGTLAPSGAAGGNSGQGGIQGGSTGGSNSDIGTFAIGTAQINVPRGIADDKYEPNETSDKAVQLGTLAGGTVSGGGGGGGGLGIGFAGMNENDSGGFVPPDTTVGVGPTAVVQILNAVVDFWDKSGNPLMPPQAAPTFFASLAPASNEELTDPIVSYDTINQKFIVGMLAIAVDANGNVTASRLLFGVSKDSNPQDGFTMVSINTTETNNGVAWWSDYPVLGWNADAYVVTFNMFPTTGTGTLYVQLVSISTSNINTSFRVDRRLAEDFTMAPAVMYGAAPGSPMWLVEENGMGNGQAIRVVEMTNILSNAPTFTDTVIPVSPYTNPAASGPWLVQDPGGLHINADDTRIFGSVWNNGILVAAHNEGLASTGNDSNAAWYELSTDSGTPTLTDQGVIVPGPGVNTYYPEITVKADGTIGMTYSESSSTEPMSMYVTGRNTSDAPGTMEPPILAIAGQGAYAQPGFPPDTWRAGDHSGIGIDFTDGSFWASAEYDFAAGKDATWGTFIQQFSIAGAGGGSNTITGVNIDVHSNGLPDYDWYRWTAGGSGTVKVVMQEIGDLEVHLFTLNSLGTMVQLGVASSSKRQGTLTVSGQVTDGAPILVEVKGVNTAPGVHAVGSYSLSIGLT